MVGLPLGFWLKQRYARLATSMAALVEYCPSILGSMILNSFRLWTRRGRAHSTRLCSRVGRLLSIALLPIIISRSTTPKP
uniref:Uncharacterized protein n=1 Tax=Arundo donax TaxID=35708 RepID=A0A0A8Y9V4_ARUDO